MLAALIDAHEVHAIDAASGDELWTFTTGARIDSPPTIDQGHAYFGSNDGYVYCVRLSNGELAWRFRATPYDQQIMVDGQLESVGPVSGSVLVLDGAVYFAVGRSSYLDGGIELYKLNAATGETLATIDLNVDKSHSDAGVTGQGLLPDVLSTDGESIYMRAARFDRNLERLDENVDHIWSSVGFLDHDWWHRTYWQYGADIPQRVGRLVESRTNAARRTDPRRERRSHLRLRSRSVRHARRSCGRRRRRRLGPHRPRPQSMDLPASVRSLDRYALISGATSRRRGRVRRNRLDASHPDRRTRHGPDRRRVARRRARSIRSTPSRKNRRAPIRSSKRSNRPKADGS